MELQEYTHPGSPLLASEGRRRFMAHAGMMTASALALGGTGAAMVAVQSPLPATPLAPGMAPLRVGMLLPEAQAYPSMAAQLMEGAQAYAAQAAGPALQFLPVVYGNRPSQAEQAAAELLARTGVDLLGGFVCANTAAQWEPLLAQHGVPLLVGDAGANALAPTARSAWVVRNSLAYWQTAWATGRWAAKALGPRAVVATAPADSAFDHLPAFERGFASAGGRVQDMLFTSAPNGTSRLDTLAQKVRQTRPDFVYVLASGADAAAFHQFWNASDMSAQLPLVAAGMLGEDLARSPRVAGQVWAARTHAGDHPALAARASALPTPFHLLGFEMAQRMHAAAVQGGGQARGLALAQAMALAALQTPRGEVRIDPSTGETVAPIHLQGLHQGPALAAVSLPAAGAAACQGLCDVLISRALGTYLAT
ncbi:ABC transporter substrate-binding protein [Acidovorax sp. LjRoot66]|uniref:ABC transporter substrate-binding protein n=1 Tax=Acidovorax sp. LjRoot66 TaxID=3342334 RepID=UPI003ECEAFD4